MVVGLPVHESHLSASHVGILVVPAVITDTAGDPVVENGHSSPGLVVQFQDIVVVTGWTVGAMVVMGEHVVGSDGEAVIRGCANKKKAEICIILLPNPINKRHKPVEKHFVGHFML